MAKYKNISGRDFSILANGRRILIPKGSIIEGPDSFRNYSALKEVSQVDYEKYAAHMPQFLKADPMNKLRSFISPNTNSNDYAQRVVGKSVLQSNFENVNETNNYINNYNVRGMPKIYVYVTGANTVDYKLKIKNISSFKKLVMLEDVRLEDLPNLDDGVVLLVDSAVTFDYDFITFVAKYSFNNKIKLPKPFILTSLNKEFVRDEILKHKIVKNVKLTIATLTHNISQYNDLIRDFMEQQTDIPFEVISIPNFNKEFTSCAEPLNIAIDLADGDIVNLCHQDLKVNTSWIDTIMSHIATLDRTHISWGVLGVAGAYKYGRQHTPDKEGNILYLSDLTPDKKSFAAIYRQIFGSRKEVQTIDELSLIIRKSTGLRFDSVTFDHFHWYGADICLQALSRGLKNFAIDADCLHLSDGQSNLSGGHAATYIEQGTRLFKKWQNKFEYFKTTTATFMCRERMFYPNIFMIINHKKGNKDLPEVIKVT